MSLSPVRSSELSEESCDVAWALVSDDPTQGSSFAVEEAQRKTQSIPEELQRIRIRLRISLRGIPLE